MFYCVLLLTGRFSLDPNRALDVILEAFELHLDDKAFFVSLIALYPCEKSTFVNILGFKFQSYQLDVCYVHVFLYNEMFILLLLMRIQSLPSLCVTDLK